ncbi:MAG: phosphoglucosamine mutase [Syntrophomonadaceae bacterium]|jgi:phosphoglucosamine mutase|nr:phosphoglucosamine mutase [Syntrophomonadaceae bacterium]
MGKLFGTDGVRGAANTVLTPELAFDLGRAGSYILAKEAEDERPRILVGKDTRISGDMLEAALTAGICASGADVLTVGVIPTPAVAYLTKLYNASCGVVISASHNPVQDNGIKFFGPNGYKLPDDLENGIEKAVLTGAGGLPRAKGDEVGRVYEVYEAYNNYVAYLLNCYEGEKDLVDFCVVLDCGNGAAYQAAPAVWKQLGAKVIVINGSPNGININHRCGSTNTEGLRRAVLSNKADLGIAFDGDADRCIVVDELGNELDGDIIMLICALDMHRRGILTPATVVATVMSNIGLDIALRREGIQVVNCAVGDRYVLEKMQETEAKLGGEQSGHIIFGDYATTGDGVLTSIKTAEVLRRNKMKISALAGEMEKKPQLLVNVKTGSKSDILEHERLRAVLKEAEMKLGEWGKLVVRTSGTEPLIRLMAQGENQMLLEEIIENIKNALEAAQNEDASEVTYQAQE